MHLTPAEQDRLTVFTVAELARRRRDRGALLSAPEVVALVADAVFEAAWDGLSMEEVIAAGRGAVRAEEARPGVAALVRRVEVDALFPTGTSLVAVDDPLGREPHPDDPGMVIPGVEEKMALAPGRARVEIEVTNTADVDVHVSSHYPFWQVNAALSFDRAAARGYRLDVPAGSSLCFPPGVTVTAELVKLGGAATAPRLTLEGGQ
ncbi:urease subunit gamma [Nonomuraea jiangxiensis]|uniref:urease n=1 Tax=Nonomuraea jiangxiensis TaxID=633440 RepID=A0A1G9H8C2_9ACTN|nr:urease subunit gamma [Nonomuraea jiangxiensis]SDL09231.1 urease subunit gamma/beta [Nonomuraea jiangxiensis]